MTRRLGFVACLLAVGGLVVGCSATHVPAASDASPTPTESLEPSAAVLAGACAYEHMILADRPAGYWTFDGPGRFQADVVPAHHGLIVGHLTTNAAISVQPGAHTCAGDKALSFGGLEGGSLVVGRQFGMANGQAFSVEAWMRPVVEDSVFRRLFDKETFTPQRGGWSVWLHKQGISLEEWAGGKIVAGVVGPAPALNTWTHVVLTSSPTGLAVYENGRLVATSRPPRLGMPQHDAPFQIGGDLRNLAYAGTIDDAAVYPFVLTQAQITAHANRR